MDECKKTMVCTSGIARDFTFSCDPSQHWVFEQTDCENEAEYCAGDNWDEASICGADGWMYQGAGGNPPGPCPAEMPAEHAECSAALGFGADRQACGYPCDSGGWSVTGCFSLDASDPYAMGEWQSDGVCSSGEGGAGNADGL
jgi:hypothetical protein